MASTYTSNSGVEKPGIGDQSGEWGTTVNTNMDILDRAINGVGVITLSGTTHTLTTTDGALSDGQYKVLVLSGSPSGTNTITISPNDQDKLYFVVNNSGQTATFSQGSGANVSVVNGDTKIIYADGAGSGAAVTEFASEADALEGITAGTVSASKAVIVDANKDITGFRNVTLTGELDAGSLDVSGNADIDGTLEADAMTLNGTAITTTATLSTGISNGNLPVFTTGVADDDFLRVAGTSIEGRSAAEVLSDIGGQASLTFGISNTNAVKIDSASVADDEYARFTASGLESRSTAEVLSDIGASPAEGSSSIVTTGALDAGSITSGFGSIDNGSSAITTTGVITGGTIEATTDTAAGDNAAVGYTSAEGLILTGQGSTSDVTIKNDADVTVLSIPTGTTNVGIGTTSPTTQLTLRNNTSAIAPIVTLLNDSFIGSEGAAIDFTYSQTQPVGARISSENDGNFAADLVFSTKTSGATGNALSERMRIDSSGNVGIGTSSPNAPLDVIAGTDQRFMVRELGTGAVVLDALNAANSAYQTLITNGSEHILRTGATERMRINSSGNVGIGTNSPTGKLTVSSDIDVLGSNFANVEFTGASVNGSGVYTGLDSGGGYVINVRDSGYIGFSTTNAERMRMLSDGQLIVAGTSFNANGSVCIGPIGTSSNGCTAVSASTSATNIWRFYNPNGQVGGISISGSATTFATSSDYRLKENVNYTFDATTRLKQLKPARFNFIADSDNTVDGFLAHEVSSVVPEAITGTKDEVDNDGNPVYQGIDQSKLVPLLVKTIQELEARITALEAG